MGNKARLNLVKQSIHKTLIDISHIEALNYICDIMLVESSTEFDVKILTNRPSKIIGVNGEITKALAMNLRIVLLKSGNVNVIENPLWKGLS